MSTEFAVGDRIETLANIYSFGAGYRGTVVEIDAVGRVHAHLDEWRDSSTGPWIFLASELWLVSRVPKAPITRDELNHERAQYQTTIDILNGLLDQIRDIADLTDHKWIPGEHYVTQTDAMFKQIVELADARPEMP